MAKTIQVHLGDLKTEFFVRKTLNDDWVMSLALLYEAGVEVAPIKITSKFEIIDGRHRKAAMELAGRQVADCIVQPEMSTVDAIVSAFSANTGGSLPPTNDDCVHTVVLLLNQGLSDRKIADIMPFPRTVTRKYLKTAWSTVYNARLQQAVKAITNDGVTLKQAAEAYKLDEALLKERLNPKRKIKSQKTLAWRREHVGRIFKGTGFKINGVFKQLIHDLEDGEISQEECEEVFNHVFNLSEKQQKRVEEFRTRMLNAASEIKKLANCQREEDEE